MILFHINIDDNIIRSQLFTIILFISSITFKYTLDHNNYAFLSFISNFLKFWI